MATVQASASRRIPHRFPGRLPGWFPVRRVVCALPLVVVAFWMVRHWQVVVEGGRGLLDADPYWLLAAVAVTALGWVAVSFTRQGTVLERLPAGRLLATQFAAGAANHVLPAGLGAGAVNLRFLRRRGLTLRRSSAALALYLLAESTARIVLLLVLFVAYPGVLRLEGLLPHGVVVPLAVGGALCAAAVALFLIRPLRTAVTGFLSAALTDARSLHTRPARVLALWGGSLAFPALQAATLVTVTRALAVPVPVIHVALAYLAASVAAAAVPTPGGLGSVDAALVFTLVTAGASIPLATSAVLGFRIVTVWLPLVPGALVLGLLVRRKVV